MTSKNNKWEKLDGKEKTFVMCMVSLIRIKNVHFSCNNFHSNKKQQPEKILQKPSNSIKKETFWPFWTELSVFKV